MPKLEEFVTQSGSCSSNIPQPIEDTSEDVCWICLEGSTPSNRLYAPCKCPSMVCHLRCLARWQLQSAGKEEENKCRFCHQELPDWKSSMTPENVRPVTPVMAIKFEGKTYKLKVKPGPDGLKDFKQQVRDLLGFDITDEFDVTFECQIPQTGEKMKLSGLSSYGAATHCAAITAAQRDVKPQRTRSRHVTSTSAGSSGAGSASTMAPASASRNGPPATSGSMPAAPLIPAPRPIITQPTTVDGTQFVVLGSNSAASTPTYLRSLLTGRRSETVSGSASAPGSSTSSPRAGDTPEASASGIFSRFTKTAQAAKKGISRLFSGVDTQKH